MLTDAELDAVRRRWPDPGRPLDPAAWPDRAYLDVRLLLAEVDRLRRLEAERDRRLPGDPGGAFRRGGLSR